MEKKEITVFSTTTCPYCVMLKAHLDENKVEYKDVNVGEDAEMGQKMFERSHQMGVPQIWIDDEVVIGFDRGRVNQLLGLKG